MQELKPCPCCGSSNGLYVLQKDEHGRWSVFCDICKTSLHNENHCDTRDDAISAWNRRADLIDQGDTDATATLHRRHCDASATCDRDALLRLARYMDKDVAETEAHFSNVISTKSVSDYARRIREACGEVGR